MLPNTGAPHPSSNDLIARALQMCRERARDLPELQRAFVGPDSAPTPLMTRLLTQLVGKGVRDPDKLANAAISELRHGFTAHVAPGDQPARPQMSAQTKQANFVDAQVGQRLRLRRKALGLSQEKLARAIGVTFQQLQKYEKGANRISASRMQQIAKVLGVLPDFFFEKIESDGGSGLPDSGAGLVDFLGSAEGAALLRAFSRVKQPKTRRLIVALVEQLSLPQDLPPSIDTSLPVEAI